MSRERRESEPWAAPPHCNSSRPNPPACSRREPRRTAPGRSHSRELPPPHPAHPAADTRAGRDVPGARPPAGEPSAVFAPPSDGALPAALRAWLEAERFPALSVVERHNFFGMLSKDEHRTDPRISPPPASPRPPHLPALCISPHRTPPRTPHRRTSPSRWRWSTRTRPAPPPPTMQRRRPRRRFPRRTLSPPPSLLAATFPRTRMPHRRPPRRQGAAGVRGRGDGARAARQRGARRGAARHRLLAAAPRRDGRQRVPLRPAGRAALGQVSDRGAYSTPSEPPSEPPPRETPPRERRLPVTHGGRRPLAALCARVGLKHAPGRATQTHRWSASSAANLG